MKNKLIRTNAVFGGKPTRTGNLDFDIEMAKSKKKPFKKAAHITRAMTSGHAFTDGNKRTAIVAVTSEMHKAGYKADKKKLTKTMINLSASGTGDIKKIDRSLRKCFKK